MTDTVVRGLARTVAHRFPAQVRESSSEQLLVTGAQLTAGVLNLGFAIVMARLQAPTEYSALAVFLALYLLAYLPLSSLSASSALDPRLARGARRWLWAGGAAVGLVIAGAASSLAPVLHLPTAMVLVLAAAMPGLGPLASERGRLIGAGRSSIAAASLVTGPAVRLAVGISLGVTFGAVGAAVGAVAGGYVALLVAVCGRSRPVVGTDERRAIGAGAWAAAVFVLLAVVQNQDLIWAKVRLNPTQAAHFAVMSTLGGAAAFATAMVPLVLLPRARRRDDGALRVALVVTAVLAGGLAAVVAIDPAFVVTAVFGARYAAASSFAAPYVGALGLFAIARVALADECARGRGRIVVVVLVGCATLQAALILVRAHTADEVGQATLVSAGAMAVASGILLVRRHTSRITSLLRLAGPSAEPSLRQPGVTGQAVSLDSASGRRAGGSTVWAALDPRRHPVAWALGAATVAATIVRLLIERGIWVDEATSIFEARMPFHQMITTLETGDVHPPLHYVILWWVEHNFGTGQLAARMPSIVAGVLTVPLLYLCGRDMFNRRTGLLAAALGAISPFLVWYSQEARPYALLMLFALLAVWAQSWTLRTDARWWHWFGYLLATVAMLWTSYWGIVLICTQQLVYLIVIVSRTRNRERVRGLLVGWLGSLVAAAALCAPLVEFAYQQWIHKPAAGSLLSGSTGSAQAGLVTGSNGSGPLNVYSIGANLVWMVWGYHADSTMEQVNAAWPLVLLLALFLLGRGSFSRDTKMLVTLVVVPLLLFVLVAFVRRNLFEVRYFAFAVPIGLLLLARLLTATTRRRTAALVLSLVVLLGSFGVGLVDEQLNKQNPRIFDFQGVLSQVATRMRPGDELVFGPQFIDQVVHYYRPGMASHPVGSHLPAPTPGHRVFVLGAFLKDPAISGQIGGLLAHYRRVGQLQTSFSDGAELKVWVFSR
ncbi:MAG: glycosyltransferase family 39 protein [Nocardioidaceae bacterium]